MWPHEVCGMSMHMKIGASIVFGSNAIEDAISKNNKKN
jgi:hypothetical protein